MTRFAVVLLLVVVPSTALAQGRRWELEAYGGVVAARTAGEGKRTVPEAGAPLVTSNPLFPSREVPSWFFGDGAALVNAVNEEFGGSSSVAPLDPLFARVNGNRTGVGGARVRRWLSDRTALELGVDFLGSSHLAPADLAATIETTRRSFADTFTQLLGSGPFTAIAVEATADTSGGSRREIAATAAFNADVASAGALTAYLTFGGGVLTGTGALPSAQLTGRYRFSILGQVPIDESDRVTIQFDRPLTFTTVVGGGLRRDVSERWSLRLDVRAYIGPDTTRVTVTTNPSTQRGTPAGFVESFTNPSIQFSNDPTIGRRSTLSAPALDDVKVFDGGFQSRTVIAVAIARRF